MPKKIKQDYTFVSEAFGPFFIERDDELNYTLKERVVKADGGRRIRVVSYHSGLYTALVNMAGHLIERDIGKATLQQYIDRLESVLESFAKAIQEQPTGAAIPCKQRQNKERQEQPILLEEE